MGYYDLTYPQSRGLGLLDDEDEDELRRRQAQIADLQPTAAMAQSSVPRATMSSLLPPADEGMDARWRQAENSALDQSGYGGERSYGIGEGLRDFAPMAIGGTLDILLNKGRGLGAISAAGMNALAGERARRDAKEKMAADDALAIRRQRESGADRGIAAEHARLRGQELELSQQQLARQMALMPDPEMVRREKEAEIGLREAQANETNANATKLWTTDPNAMTPYQQALLDEQKAEHQRLNEDRDLSRQQQKELREATIANTQAVQAAAAQTRADNELEKQRNTFRTKTEKTRPQLGRMEEIDSVLANPNYAKDIPGIGPIDSHMPEILNSPDANKMKMAVADMADMLVRQREGAVAPPAMYATISRFVNAGPNATDSMFRDAYTAYKQILQEEIRQQASGRPQAAREVLGRYADSILGPEQQPQPTTDDAVGGVVTSGPANYGPDADHPSNLGVVGGRRLGDIPEIPMTPGGGQPYRAGSGRAQAAGTQPMPGGTANGIRVRSPSGNVGVVTPEQWELLKNKPGWGML